MTVPSTSPRQAQRRADNDPPKTGDRAEAVLAAGRTAPQYEGLFVEPDLPPADSPE